MQTLVPGNICRLFCGDAERHVADLRAPDEPFTDSISNLKLVGPETVDHVL
jgi:hypothetical protein